MMRILATAALAAALAIPVLAATRFPDVADDHPRAGDIEYVASQSPAWFGGYPDSSFKPDRRITARQMTAVIERAFPDGMTRAEFASFLRGGEWRVESLKPRTGDAPLGSFRNPFDLAVNWYADAAQETTLWEFEVLSVTDNADAAIREYNQFNDPPRPGYRVLLVRIRATYHEGELNSLSWWQFGAITPDGLQIDDCNAALIPDRLEGTLLAGASKEGNVCIEAPIGVKPHLTVTVYQGASAVVSLP